MKIEAWRALVYGEGYRAPKPEAAQRALDENPQFAIDDPHAAGIYSDQPPSSGMSPLAAVTHSALSRVRPAQFAECARKHIAAGADLNADKALYGAAGKNHQPEITSLLLAAGADPNDDDSVYHATESRDLTCLKLLLAAGARAKGTNALNHSLDYDDLACTQLLLDAGADPNEGAPALFWAIRRRRSLAHAEALLKAGANPQAAIHGVTMYRAARLFGLTEIAARLQMLTAEEPNPSDAFAAACACADRDEASRLLADNPKTLAEMPPMMLRLLPDSVEAGNVAGAKLMVDLGWPVDAKGGDWQATALNLAIFRGDPELTGFLLRHGANWQERHGYNDTAVGTLSFASMESPVANGDWLACAKAMIEEGSMPPPSLEDYSFSREIEQYFETLS